MVSEQTNDLDSVPRPFGQRGTNIVGNKTIPTVALSKVSSQNTSSNLVSDRVMTA